ncbi:MAG: homocysteine S-methyltransferase family protein [Kiritimatiellae bacterium]|jgi:methionine synthase I (cobalamin-dependent)/5,10-methylenetetrahydrofolate reductase|nr:homocysteine S-methyltransferase family protein [Kiritimatiellia bacterium]
MKFLDENKIIIFDSAIGTELVRKGIEQYPMPELLNIAANGIEILEQIYEESIASGADFITANSFHANAYHLAKIGFEDETENICKNAIEICKRVSNGRVKVAGSIGPLDVHRGADDISHEDFCDFYRPQISALVAAGADLLLLETFANPKEADAALEVASSFELPIIMMMVAQRKAKASRLKTINEFVSLAEKYKIDAIGLNCAPPHTITEYIEDLCTLTNLPIMVSPNAGTPKVERGIVSYQLPANTLIQEAEIWYNCGAQIFGGCCGTAPEHIQALYKNMKHRVPVKHQKDVSTYSLKRVQFEIPENEIAEAIESNSVRKLFNDSSKIIAVEMRFEANCDISKYIEEAGYLKTLGCNLFTVPDNPGANIGIDSITMAKLLQKETDTDTIFHKSATHTNLINLYSSLLGAWATDLKAILAVSGDPPATGAFSRFASRITDIRSSVEFLKLIKMLESGECVNNQQLKQSRSFFRACAFAPQRNTDSQIEWLNRKIDAGAEAAFTQPFFTQESFIETEKRIEEFTQDIKILNGVFPILSAKQAKVLASGRIPGIVIPDSYIGKISEYSDINDQMKFGIEQATLVAQEVFSKKNSIYLILPFGKNRFEIIKEIISNCGR